ncbi:2-hydroxymuconate tautomerase family protein [bacterium]|jgi:4-oxalocrotonate tautomerase|nr:2-hydroxymuconate tautomerase family protein [bacterium]
MPFIQVTMMEGRTVEQKHELMKQLTEAVVNSIGSDPSRVRVAIYEVTPDEWAVAGEAMSVIQARK